MRTVAALLLLLFPVAAYAFVQRRESFVYESAEPQEIEGIDASDYIPESLPFTLSETTFLESIGIVKPSNQTRGERNNNPGNIRISAANWQGKIGGADSAFETFDSPESGIRALAKLLKNYQTNYGLDTVRGIIGRYAPASENNTSAYVANVAGSLGVSPDARINVSDAGILTALVNAIIKQENGRNIYSSSTVAKGVSQA